MTVTQGRPDKNLNHDLYLVNTNLLVLLVVVGLSRAGSAPDHVRRAGAAAGGAIAGPGAAARAPAASDSGWRTRMFTTTT